MWDPQRLTTLWASMAWYRDSFTFLCVSLGSRTVQLHDSLRSRRACACSEAGFSSQNGDSAEEQRSVVRFWWAKGLDAKDIHKEIIPVYGGTVCRVNRFTTGSRNSLKDVRKSQMMPDQVRKWLRQQSKDFCAAGFDALVERWVTCCQCWWRT
jgi:hypothetical protein